ncbi:condensation domain-containing protein [Clostridium estertheticum]|uniref:condensation domain-containing protein n=1 Tax=Clostridium estertheticum TaxID=238834 RepID=UPI001CF493DF|nr:condensation domain-containing protein [Clostridium estertheticum]MCB2354690.1 condensation domain-containing protein [Clostridium estertheticum]WAG40935.1 condensation domain-containing protein [Clostridium estertheticum]
MDFNSIKLSGFNVKKNIEVEKISKKDIAIIGMHGQLPQAGSMDEFWEKLKANVDFIREFPESRKKDSKPFAKLLGLEEDSLQYCQGAYLDEIDKFDYSFFRISPKEASLMDPAQRLFLETAWNAVEDAGYGGKKLVGSRTGVFVGFGGWPIYGQMACRAEKTLSHIAAPGTLAAMIPSRIAYLMDFRGPAMLIDTACSSSLVAVHQACRSIRSGECKTAIVGSININYVPVKLESKDGVGIESSSGRTKAFDESSDGTGWGEGVIAVVLKPLDKAMKDRDNIYAIIKGSAINQDGSSIGITAPNALAQEDVILKAWEDAEVDPETISYIETHGTGTKLGDPIEMEGIQRAFQVHTNKKQFCALGTVKANVGHLANSAGIMGLLKATLVLKNKEIPPLLHFQRPNRKIDFIQSPVYINENLIPWEPDGFPRRCGVSSFGFSGTNCHVVMEEALKVKNECQTEMGRMELLTISAKTENALLQLVKKYSELAEKNTTKNLGDVCYTANTGRGHYNYRLVLILKDWDDLKQKLSGLLACGIKDTTTNMIYYGEHRISAANVVAKIDTSVSVTKKYKESLGMEAEIKVEEFLSSTEWDRELMEKICRLYVSGAEVEWEKIHSDGIFYKVSIPVYPFERNRCWVDWDYSKENKSIDVLGGREVANVAKPQGLGDVISQIDMGQYEKLGFNIEKKKMLGVYKEELVSIGENLMAEVKNYSMEEGTDIFKSTGKTEEMKEYMELLLLKAFQGMGIIKVAGESYNKKELIEHLGILDKYNRLFDSMLDILIRGEFVEYKYGVVKSKAKVSNADIRKKIDSIDELGNRLCNEAPAIRNYIKIVSTCTKSYKEVLNGKISGTEILFPNGSTDLIDSIYKDNSNMEGNKLAAQCIKECIKMRLGKYAKGNKVRILEVGAGVGVATSYVLEAIKEYVENVEYYYTDISKSLVEYGQNTYGSKYPFVIFKKLDLEKDAKSQGFDLNNFDLVLAVNVIHATRNIKQTIGRIKKLMKRNGTFLLLEGTCRQDFSTLTFGLLDGWWIFEDTDLRIEYSPMLTVDTWERVLDKTGFTNIDVIGTCQNDISLVAGESDGIIELDVSIENMLNQPEGIEENSADKESTLEVEEENSNVKNHIISACKNILGYEKISTEDNFYELGGDSIVAIKVISLINHSLNIKVDVVELLKYPYLKEFIAHIEGNYLKKGQEDDKYKPILPLKKKEYYAVSSAQKRIYLDNEIEVDAVNYNIPWAILLEGSLNREKIKDVFWQLINRHETLHTFFDLRDDAVVQFVNEDIEFDMEYEELNERAYCENCKELTNGVKGAINSFIRPFNLAKAPLIHVKLLKLMGNAHILLFDMHHIISDAGSMGILIKEFNLLYNEYKLPELKVQYKDFAEWHNRLLKSDELKKQEKYWLDKFSSDITRVNFPTDYPRSSVRSFEGDDMTIILDKNLNKKLTDLTLKTGTTLFMVLLANMDILISKYTGQEDIIIGSGATSRNHKDTEGILGVFVDSFATRNYPRADKTFKSFIEEVREDTLKIYENKDYQFEMLIQKLNLERDLSRNPLYDMLVVLNEEENYELNMGSLKITPLELKKISRMDLALYITKGKTNIKFTFEYCKKLFKRETIEKLLQNFVNILEQVCEEPDIEISKIDMLSKEEREINLVKLDEYISKIKGKKEDLDINFKL